MFFRFDFCSKLALSNADRMNFISSLIIAATFSSLLHPLHVAYSNIDINTDQKTIAVSHKVFTQDFTILFAHLFEKTIEPKADTEFTQPEVDLITHYMNHRFILVSQSDTISLKYNSKQMEGESLFLFFNGTYGNKNLSEITINNLLLLDLYMDQTNLVIVNNGSREQGLTFDWDTREATLMVSGVEADLGEME